MNKCRDGSNFFLIKVKFDPNNEDLKSLLKGTLKRQKNVLSQ